MKQAHQIRTLLRQNKPEAAFRLMETALERAPEALKRRWIDLSGQARLAETEYRQNRISFEEYSAARERSHQGLLALLGDWEEQEEGLARSSFSARWLLVPALVLATLAGYVFFKKNPATPANAAPALPARFDTAAAVPTQHPPAPPKASGRPVSAPQRAAPMVRLVLLHNTYCKDEPVWVDGQPARLLQPGMNKTSIEVRADTLHSF
ncbi:MAG TPA: hypothetical protein PLW66_14990, partial [Saprospiraceae bacterium]|nr:hypothetical protein [Saprospiraceae bacterium]